MSEQKRENGLLARGQSLIRDIMLAVFGNEALFLIVAFLYATLGDNAIAAWYREPVSLLYGYIVIPWGAALCGMASALTRMPGVIVSGLFIIAFLARIPREGLRMKAALRCLAQVGVVFGGLSLTGGGVELGSIDLLHHCLLGHGVPAYGTLADSFACRDRSAYLIVFRHRTLS